VDNITAHEYVILKSIQRLNYSSAEGLVVPGLDVYDKKWWFRELKRKGMLKLVGPTTLYGLTDRGKESIADFESIITDVTTERNADAATER
jgi:hypothetical protein